MFTLPQQAAIGHRLTSPTETGKYTQQTILVSETEPFPTLACSGVLGGEQGGGQGVPDEAAEAIR